MLKTGPSKLLQLLENPVTDTVPKGWLTAAQIAKRTNMSIPQTTKNIRDGILAGYIDVRKFRIPIGNGTTRPVNHYLIRK